jgi:hypothetical protein
MPLGAGVNGGVDPLSSNAAGYANKVASGFKDIDPEKVRALLVPMFVTLDDTATSGYDVFRVPTTHDFVIEKILPHLALTDLANEVATPIGNAVVAGIMDRMVMKAANARIDLQNTDRNQKVIDGRSLSLASIYGPAGGDPIDLKDTPHKIPAGESVRLDVALIAIGGAAANVEKGKTQYGIVLVGKLVRVAKS